MYMRNWIFAPILALIAAAPAARAADPAATTPTLVVRVKSIDGLIADAKYLAGLAGQEEQANQLEKMLPSFLGPKGLNGTGFDTAKPWGMYAVLKPEIPTSPVVVLIPVADENAFVASLKTLAGFAPGGEVTIVKGDDDFYTVRSPVAPVAAYFTIADGYAYITALQKESISKANRLPAAKLLPADDKTIFGLTARFDTIDPQFKQMALGQFENQIAAAKERKSPKETPAQTKLKELVIDYLAGEVRSFLTDARAVEFQLALDRKADDFTAQLSLTANPDSPLAKQIDAVGQRQSRFGSLHGSAGQAALTVAVPEVLRSAVFAAFDEGFHEAQGKQKDAIKKDMAQKFYDVLAPTLKAGELDTFIGLVGPNAAGKYTLAGGIKLQDAAKVDQLARDLVPMIPDPRVKEAISFDAETIDGVKVHKAKVYDLDDNAHRLFGDSPVVLIAFPENAQVFAFGAEPGDVLKQVLASAGKSGGPFHLEASIGRLATLDKDNGPRAKEVAAAAFGPDPKTDVVRASLDGGSALRLRASVKTQIIKFGVKMDEAAKNGN